MYICPTCQKEFKTENDVVKHCLKCWKEKNPSHKSNPAPRSKDVIIREENTDILNFFSSLKERV